MRGGVVKVAMEAQSRGPSVVERLRAVHLRMVDVVLGGEGLEGVATLAAGETGGVVAIVVPRLGAAAASAPVAQVPAPRRHLGGPGGGRVARGETLRGRTGPWPCRRRSAGGGRGGADRDRRRAARRRPAARR